MPAVSEGADTSPRIKDLIGYTDASLEHGISMWSLKTAASKGEIRTYKLPGNRIGLDRRDVETWVAARHK